MSVATHPAVPMVVPPASDDRGKIARFHLGTIVRVVDNVFDFLTKSFEVRRLSGAENSKRSLKSLILRIE